MDYCDIVLPTIHPERNPIMFTLVNSCLDNILLKREHKENLSEPKQNNKENLQSIAKCIPDMYVLAKNILPNHMEKMSEKEKIKYLLSANPMKIMSCAPKKHMKNYKKHMPKKHVPRNYTSRYVTK